MVAPSTQSRTAPAKGRAGPDSPAATTPPMVLAGPSLGGSNASRWPHSASRASISASGVPARATTTSSLGS